MALFAVSFMDAFLFGRSQRLFDNTLRRTTHALALAIACIAPFSGLLADRIGTRWLAAGGLTMLVLAW